MSELSNSSPVSNSAMKDPESFFQSELQAYPLASENFKNLDVALADAVTLTASEPWRLKKVLVNHRRASITAKIDAASIAERPCFLCESNRPPQQGAIPWNGYQILVNPYPLAPRHYTIVSCHHEPQAIDGRIGEMAALTLTLSDFCVFYNGPRCGASAPDHFHFQAASKEIAANILSPDLSLQKIWTDETGVLYRNRPGSAPFPFFIIEADNAESLERIFSHLWSSMPQNELEPMVNLAMVMTETKRLRLFIAPRQCHRPRCYDQGENSCLISPASIEMLGNLVCSRREDFDRLDLTLATSILSEVGLAEDLFNNIINSFNSDL